MVAVIAVALASAGGHARRPVRGRSAPQLLAGVPAGRTSAGLFLGGENLWWVGRLPQAVAAVFLRNGLSPLLPGRHGAEVDQLVAVRGGVVAHIGDISTGITYGALGRVVFIPDAGSSARVIGRATMIAVPPGGERVWVQTAIQAQHNGEGVPASFRSPTWAVNLAGRRVSPVLRLPFGLVGATEQGPLTQNLATGRLQLWNGGTGAPLPLPLHANVDFVAAGRDRLVWYSSSPPLALHITNLRTGSDVAVPLPRNWSPASGTYPPPGASFDPAGRRLVLPFDRTDSAGNITAEDLFVVDTATRTLTAILSKPLLIPVSASSLADTVAGAWDRHGRLWVLAMNPANSHYQLGFWTGAGPLHTMSIAQGLPIALSAPG